jgi:hypothetical protein
MWRRIPDLYIALALGAVVSVALSLLVLSGAFGPRTTVAGSIFFIACDTGQPDPGCIQRSHWASGVAVEYRAIGLLPVSYTTHTGSDGQYSLDLPPGKYQVIIQGCTKWPDAPTNPPQAVVERQPVDPHFRFNWLISPNGTCQIGGIAL